MSAQTEQILGIPFFNGTATKAVDYFLEVGGLLVAPALPALINLKYDLEYRRAMQAASVAVPDSMLLTVMWKAATGGSLRKISGTEYLRTLLRHTKFRSAADTLWLVATESAKDLTLELLGKFGIPAERSNVQVVPDPVMENDRYHLLNEMERRQPANIVIAISSGSQEKLGSYLREYAVTRPNVHCVGAALAFLTGEQHRIPNWAEKYGLGWFVRLTSQPKMILPRFGIAAAVTAMVLRHKSQMPPLQKRWADI